MKTLSVLAAILLLAAGLAAGPQAAVDVSMDAETLNDFLSAMAPADVQVALPAGRFVTLQMRDLRVTGFDPAGGDEGQGQILASLQLVVPELGLDIPVEPRLSLKVNERDGKKVAYLRFDRVELPLPITGPLDVSSLLPLLPIHTDKASWVVSGARGPIRVQPKLVEAKLGAKNLRLSFDLALESVERAGS